MATASTTIAADVQAEHDELWAMRFLFCHNWEFPVRVSTAFTTQVASALNSTEQRWGMVDKPYRTIRAVLTIAGRGKIAKFRNLIARRGQAQSLVPLYSDETYLTAAPSSSSYVYSVENTSFRRFCPGQRIVVAHRDGPDVTAFTVHLVASVTTTTITVTGAYADTQFGEGDSVYPLIEAQVSLVEDADAISDQCVSFTLEAIEVLGNNTLDTTADLGDIVSPDTFDGKQVLGIPVDWAKAISMGAERTGDYSTIGRGFSLQTFGSRSRWTMKLPFTQLSREDAWDLLQFFESVGGRLLPFYAISPFSDMELVSLDSTTVTVLNVADEDIDWQYYTHIAIVEKSGTVTIRAIEGTPTESGDNHVITVAELDPVILAEDIDRVCFAHLMRFNSDSFEESWVSDGVLETSLELIELFSEEPAPITDIHILPDESSEVGLTANCAVLYVNLLTFGYRGTFARYISFNRNFTDLSSNLFLALPAVEIDMKKQSGSIKDEPIEITLPPVLPFSLLLDNQAVGPISCLIEEMDKFDESTRRTLFYGTAETLTGNKNGRSDVVLVNVKGHRSCLEVGLGIPANNSCAWGFGDKTCRKDVGALAVVCTVVSITDRVMVISDSANPAPYFRVGYVTRNGLSLFIREQTANDTLVFVDKPPDEWVGQTVSVTPGCDKSLSDCRNKWSNEENFGGFGHAIPSYHPLFESQ